MERKPVEVMEDGWSEWIHPVRHSEDVGYLMQCCDCGLIHEMEFALGSSDTGHNVLLFRARRYEDE